MPRNVAKLIREKLEAIAANPYPDHPNAKKLQGRNGYRLRVGDWRVIYEIQNDQLVILVLRVAPTWRGVPMKENIQLIERNGKPEWTVLPYEKYLKLLEKAEMLEDIRDYDAAKAALENGDKELIHAEVVFAILDGKNPIKAWREYRGLTQQQLADKAGISKPYLSQIETGKRAGKTEILSVIAKVLDLSLDEVITTENK